MIALLRVDHRLLHGQIAYSWVTYLGVNCILIANDGVMNDALRKAAIELAKPNGIKLVIKGINDSIKAINSGVTDKYKLLIVVEKTDDAITLAKNCDRIKEIDLGNIKDREGAKQIGLLFNITEDEELKLKELVDSGVKVGVQRLPEDKYVSLENSLRG